MVYEVEVTRHLGAELDDRRTASRHGCRLHIVVYRAAALVRGGQLPQGVTVPIEGLMEPQGEGVALGGDGTMYLASEGRPWKRGGRFIRLRCPR